MTGKVFISLNDLGSALASLSEKMAVWVPALAAAGKEGVEFQPFRAGLAPVMDRQATAPPKRILLPQSEALLHFQYDKDPMDPSRVRLRLDDQGEMPPTLVFGARPCDVRGFTTFDRVFLDGPYTDSLYLQRRRNTSFATLVCTQGDGACFCSSVGSGPADLAGSDLRILPVEGGYVVDALNDRGRTILESMCAGSAAGPPSAGQEEAARRVLEEASNRQVGDLDVSGTMELFRKRFDDKEYWQRMVSQCLSCGICTFLCPTCYCFTITDEARGLRGDRLRSWDSCMFHHYTLEASGHNPRPTKFERYRNRVGHKFSTIPEKYDGLMGCCGCGRCVRSCPVSVDIREIVRQLEEEVCECP